MASQIYNVVRFSGLQNGVPTPLPHDLNLDGIPLTPDQCAASAGGFSVTANATDVEVTREPGAPDFVDVLVKYTNSPDRVFGPSNPQPNAAGTPSGLGAILPTPFSSDLSALNPGAPKVCLVYSNKQPTGGNVYGAADWELCLEVANSIAPSKGRAMICFDTDGFSDAVTVPAPATAGDLYNLLNLEFFIGSGAGRVVFAPGQRWSSFPNFRTNRICNWVFNAADGAPIVDTDDAGWIGGFGAIGIINVGAHFFRNSISTGGSDFPAFRSGLGDGTGSFDGAIALLSRASRFELVGKDLAIMAGDGSSTDGRFRTEAQSGALVIPADIMKSEAANAGIWDIMFMGAVQRGVNFQPENQTDYSGKIRYPGQAPFGTPDADNAPTFFYNPRNTPNPLIGGFHTANVTAAHGDHIRCDASMGAFTVTLPDPRAHLGETVTVFALAGEHVNAVTVSPSAGATINNDPGPVAQNTSQAYRVAEANNIGTDVTGAASGRFWDAL